MTQMRSCVCSCGAIRTEANADLLVAYVQIPVPEIDWQVPVPHSPLAPLPRRPDGVQINAQYLPPVGVCKAHVGVAVSPFGISVGQDPFLHGGLQKSPDTPWTWTAFSSDSQPVFGLP